MALLFPCGPHLFLFIPHGTGRAVLQIVQLVDKNNLALASTKHGTRMHLRKGLQEDMISISDIVASAGGKLPSMAQQQNCLLLGHA